MDIVGRMGVSRPWEHVVGYSRAIRKGQLIEVSGTTATTTDGQVMYPYDAYEQMKYILQEIKVAIEELGATFDDTMRTRISLTNIEDWPSVATAHREVFNSVMPACSFTEISKLMLPELCVQVEMTLWV
jgi:enamine deaminase RidA (YjgF/YER057c/UK114 family)